MYRGITLMFGLAYLVLSAPSQAVTQQRASERVTQAQIVSAIGSDADAGRVVWRVFSHAFAYRGSRHHLLREQVRAEWLPHIEGTDLVSGWNHPAIVDTLDSPRPVTAVPNLASGGMVGVNDAPESPLFV